METKDKTTSDLRTHPDPKKVGDIVDVEGAPFQIKKILPGRRVMLKELDYWPADAPDWQKKDRVNRVQRRAMSNDIRAELEALGEGEDLAIDPDIARNALIPLLEGEALVVGKGGGA